MKKNNVLLLTLVGCLAVYKLYAATIDISIVTTPAQDRGIKYATALYNASSTNSPLTEKQYLILRINDMINSWASITNRAEAEAFREKYEAANAMKKAAAEAALQ